jgi:phosphohistidine phosphatase
MFRLVLIRHSEAQPHAAGGDKERVLTPAGRDMAARVGTYCGTMQLHPDLVLISPALRTRETFEGLAQGIGQKLNASYDPALYNATSTAIKAIIAKTPSELKTVFVIGHNPGIGETAIALCGSGNRAMLAEMRHHFPAPAMAIVDFQMDHWAELAAGRGQLIRFVTKAML